VAKFGLGTLISFEFLAPCFGDNLKDQKMLQYYGKIKFDFRQFGDDEAALQKTKPTLYC
jgi:hypothetical protein